MRPLIINETSASWTSPCEILDETTYGCVSVNQGLPSAPSLIGILHALLSSSSLGYAVSVCEKV